LGAGERPGDTLVVTMAARETVNLRTYLEKIIIKAGHEPWPRPAFSFDLRALGSRNLFHLRSDAWKTCELFPDFAAVSVMPLRGRLRSTVSAE
jgi:hypothetical protein